MQGRYTHKNENSSSHSGEVTLQTSWLNSVTYSCISKTLWSERDDATQTASDGIKKSSEKRKKCKQFFMVIVRRLSFPS